MVVAELAVAIESIDGSTKATWMSPIELSLGHTEDPVVVECSILTGVGISIKSLLEASELDESRETCEALLDVVEQHKLVFKWVEHLLMPERDVHFTEVMEALDLQTSLLVLDAFDQNPNIEELRLILLLLDVSQNVITSGIRL